MRRGVLGTSTHRNTMNPIIDTNLCESQRKFDRRFRISTTDVLTEAGDS